MLHQKKAKPMNKRIKLILISLFLSFIISYLISIFYTTMVSKSIILLSHFTFPWIIHSAFLTFFERFPSLHFTILILLYSFIFPQDESITQRLPRNKLLHNFSSALILFIVITCSYIILFEAFFPLANRKVQYYERISKIINDLEKQKTKAYSDDLNEVLQILQIERSVYPEKLHLEEEITKINSLLRDQEKVTSQNMISKKVEQSSVTSKDSTYYMTKARNAFNDQDWASTILFAQRALELQSTLTEASQLLNNAKSYLKNPELIKSNQDNLFEAKRKALTLLEIGNTTAAYYQFKTLSTLFPLDNEIQNYLKLSQQEVSKTAFFFKEVKNLESFSRLNSDLVFVLKHKEDVEILFHWDKIVKINNIFYIQNINAFAFSSQGQILYSFTAPYGKIHNNLLLLRCLDEDNPDEELAPKIRPYSINNVDLSQIPLPNETTELLPSHGFSIKELQGLSLGQLFKVQPLIKSLGYREELVESEILERLLKIFSIISLSFLSIAFGWSLRYQIHKYKPSRIFIFSFPILFYITNYLYEFYLYLNKILFSYLLLYHGVALSRILLLILQVLIIVSSAIYYFKIMAASTMNSE